MKHAIALLVMIATSAVFSMPASASDAIGPYVSKHKSGQFSYAVYNASWLMADPAEGTNLVAIIGLSPDAKGDIVIPTQLGEFKVYGIDDNAFTNCNGINSISIPKTVRFLKPGTLNRCEGLESIKVDKDNPDFASIGGVMFNKQKTDLLSYPSGGKTQYAIPDTTTSIGPFAFTLCKNLTSVSIPKSVTDIGGRNGGAFRGCSSLERIEIPKTVTKIGQKSFENCSSLVEIELPPNITEIPFGLFWKCSNLTSIALPDGVIRIGNYAFADCEKMKLRSLPEKLTTIGAYAFKNCKSLENISIPKGATNIGRGAFSGTDVKVAN